MPMLEISHHLRLPLAALPIVVVACSGPGPVKDSSHTHTPALAELLADSRYAWVSAETQNVRVHGRIGSGLENDLGALGVRAESAIERNRTLLGVAAESTKVELFFVASRAEMRPLVGWTPGGHALPAENAAFMVANDVAGAPLVHELMHVLSWRAWGEPIGAWVSEGVAMLGISRCQGWMLHELAADLHARESLVPLAELPRRFSVKEAGHYAQAGSLVAYVHDRFGAGGVHGLWVHGLRDAQSAVGITRDQLEADWRTHLTALPPNPVDWNAIRQRGCETR